MNIVTVKLGDKFDSSFVNRVYEMCKRNLTQDFNFFCYTDNFKGIDPYIHIIEHEDMSLKPVFYKLYLFYLFQKGLYLDLDVVIQNNIDHLPFYAKRGCVSLIRSQRGYNSSVMAWDSTDHLWSKFMCDPEKYMMIHRGIDTYLESNAQVCHFSQFDIYSRLYGIYGCDDKPIYIPETGRHKEYYYPNMPICIFNSYNKTIDVKKGYMLDDQSYEGFEHYWS